MKMTSGSNQPLIDKKVLYAGSKNVHFTDGCKVHFHFQTRLCDLNKTLLDDSRKMGDGKPFELVLGKKFKLEVWEVMVQKMALNEVATFTVDKSLVIQYPFVSKALRDVNLKREHRTHCCAMTLQSEGVGYEDLNEFLKSPSNLEFTIELLKVEEPDNYEKESWQLSEDEKIKETAKLKATGNKAFEDRNYGDAANQYAKAIGIIEQLMLREKPHDEEWNQLDKLKLPLLLNYSQCQLNLGDYYSAIEHLTTALKTDPNNVKAYFRRAKAHVGAWNPQEAIKDFNQAMELDKSLTGVVKKELAALDELIKTKNTEEARKMKNLFSK